MSIQFQGVSKKFGDKEVLRDLSFEVKTGEILFILGKSGMGKSVTLKTIVGMLKPETGRVYVDRVEVTGADSSELAAIRRKCGMVFQHPALLDSLTVLENISFGLKTQQYKETLAKPLSEDEIKVIVLGAMRNVRLEPGILNRYPSELSYGMQKRVSLARTLAPKPSYLLFDEPTTGLDPITTEAMNKLIVSLSRELSVTSVVVSHDMDSALKTADRILVLDEGQILSLGTPDEIQGSKQPLIVDFLAEVQR